MHQNYNLGHQVWKTSFYTHFAHFDSCVMLPRHLYLTQVCIYFTISNMGSGDGDDLSEYTGKISSLVSRRPCVLCTLKITSKASRGMSLLPTRGNLSSAEKLKKGTAIPTRDTVVPLLELVSEDMYSSVSDILAPQKAMNLEEISPRCI